MRPYQLKSVTYNSSTGQELSDNVKIIENGQDLTMWLGDESGYIPRLQDFSNFDHIYLQPQACREVRFLLILILLIYSINSPNLEYLQHQQRHSYLAPSWSHTRDFPLVF